MITITAANEFRYNGHDGSLICDHRDLSCCDACAAAHPDILEVAGAHFWMTGEAEIRELTDFFNTIN